MPMSITFDDLALKYLISPPKPSYPLRDIILTVRKSVDINALAMMGRGVLRSCIMARTFNPPIADSFQSDTDAKIEDERLARIANECGLLERLNVHGVATDKADMAHILCAYLGATLRSEWTRVGCNNIPDSINDICSLVLGDEDPEIIENNSHERMAKISNLERMSPVKSEPPPMVPSPTPSRDPQNMAADMETNSNGSFSSGRSPPPHMHRPHYQQFYQPYYPPNPSNPPPPPPHPVQHIPLQHIPLQPTTIPQRFVSYAPGPVPTASPSFMPQQPQPGTGAFPPGQGAYQPQYGTTSSQGIPTQPQPNNMHMPSGSWMSQQNPPSYTMPPQASAPGPMPMPPPPSQQTQGFISLFNELAMKQRMATSWQQQKSGQQHIPEWTMWLVVDGTPRGHGTAATKQGAKEIAAKIALQSLGWLPA